MRIALVRGALAGLCPFRLLMACTAGEDVDVFTVSDQSYPQDADLVIVDFPSAKQSLHYIGKLREVSEAGVLLIAQDPEVSLLADALRLAVTAFVPAPVEDAAFQSAYQSAVSRLRQFRQNYVPASTLAQAQDELRRVKHTRMFHDLQTGNMLSDLSTEQLAELYNLSLLGDQNVSICVCLDPPVGAAYQDFRTMLQELTSLTIRSISTWPVRGIFSETSSLLLCLFNFQQLDLAGFCAYLHKVYQSRYPGWTVTLGCSLATTQFSDLADAMDQARNCIRSRMLYGGGQVLTQELLDREPSVGRYGLSFQQVIRLHTSVTIGDAEATQALLDELFQSFAQQPPSMHDLYYVLDQLVTAVFGAISRNKHSRSKTYSFTLAFWGLVDRAASLSALHRQLRAWLYQTLRREDAQGVPAPIRQSLRYLGDHLDNRACLRDAAEEVGLTPSYLSAMFRRYMGWNFSEYLQALRLSTAATLLRDTNLSVAEITRTVGFSDYRYFTRIFSHSMGATPTQFRKSCQLEGLHKS